MSYISIVLIKEIPNLGKVGETAKVKAGFARNYLIPQKLAVPLGSLEAKKIIQDVKAHKEEKAQKIKIKEEKKIEKELKHKAVAVRKKKLLAKAKK